MHSSSEVAVKSLQFSCCKLTEATGIDVLNTQNTGPTMKKRRIKSNLPVKIFMENFDNPDMSLFEQLRSALLQAFPQYLMSCDKSQAAGVVYIDDKKFHVNILLLNDSDSSTKSVDKKVLNNLWKLLIFKGVNPNKVTLQTNASEYLQFIGKDAKEEAYDRVRDSIEELMCFNVYVMIKCSTGELEESWHNCCDSFWVDSSPAEDSQQMTILMRPGEFVPSALNP